VLNRRSRLSVPALFILTAMAAMWIIPLLWTFNTALRPQGQSVSVGSMFQTQLTLENFARAWHYAPFGQYYLNTIILVVGVLALQLITTTLAAFAFARMEFRGRDVLFLLFLLQMMVPAEALVVPNFATIRTLGLVNTRIAMMLPYVASAFGTFLIRQTFRQVPRELEEAAAIDGCNTVKTLWHVFIPLARPTLVAYGLVSVCYHWNNFFWPMIVTNSPDKRPLTVGLALFAKAVESGADWSLVSAGTIIVILPLLGLFLVFQRQFISSFMQSGIK
jgi:sn-glycerol 3-phosphate transport system permease protein